MATAPTEFTSALIQSLRGTAGKGGQEGTGITFLPNAVPAAGGGLVPRDYRGMAFNPQMLTMPVLPPRQAPTPPAPGEELTPVPPVRDIEPLPPIEDIVVPDDGPVAPALPDVPIVMPPELDPLPEGDIAPLPEVVVPPEIEPVPELPEVLPPPDLPPEQPPADDRPETLTPLPDPIVVDVKPPKKDASGWGEGGQDLVRDDTLIVPSLPDPVPVIPELLPELPMEDIPLLPEDVDLPEVLPVPDLPVPAPEEEDPVEVVTDAPVRYMPATAPVIAPLEQAPVDRVAPTPSPEPLPEDVDLPEVEPIPEIIVPGLIDPVPVLPEDLAPIDNPIELLPEDIVLPEVLPIPDLPMSPSDLAPIELLPEEIDLPTIDELPELNDNEAALTDLYAEVFNRAPDQGGFDFWLSAINDLGYTPEMVRAEFMRSPEYQDLQAQQRDRRLLDESAFVG